MNESQTLHGLIPVRTGATGEEILRTAVEAADSIATERDLHAVSVRLIALSIDPVPPPLDDVESVALFSFEAIKI